jgi:hypothetical protein
MNRTIKLTALVMLLAALMAGPVWALVPLPPTVPDGVTPAWTPVTGRPGLAYATNLKVDLFRYRGRYYYWVAAHWRVSDHPRGPWKPTDDIPSALRHLDPALFKSIYKPDTKLPANR